MIYIDCFKKTKELFKTIEKCNEYYPNATIVGDDLVFDTVKQALFEVKNKFSYSCGLLHESYILTKKGLDDYKKDYNNEETIYDKIVKLLQNKQFDDTYDIIKSNKLDLNESVYEGGNTIYHEICIVLRNMNDKDAILEKFTKYQNPKDVKNELLLIWKDYYEFGVYL